MFPTVSGCTMCPTAADEEAGSTEIVEAPVSSTPSQQYVETSSNSPAWRDPVVKGTTE